MNGRIKITVILVLFILVCAKTNAQIVVNPLGVFFDPVSKTAEAQLKNTSSKPLEVKISFEFIYENWLDSTGKVTLIRNDSVKAAQYSLNNYIKVFPKKIIIPPGKEQTIRFLLTNVSGLEDGTYWTRIKFTSVEVEKQFDTTGKSANIGSKFKLINEITIPIVFQKGKVFAGVDVKKYDIIRNDDDSVVIAIELERTGNSPFWGNITFELHDMTIDKIINVFEDACPLYFETRRTLAIPKSYLKSFSFPGDFKLVMMIHNENMKDIPEDRRYNVIDLNKDLEFRIE